MLKEGTLVIVRAAPKKFYENLKPIHQDYIPPLEWRKSTLINSKEHQRRAKIESWERRGDILIYHISYLLDEFTDLVLKQETRNCSDYNE